MLTLENIETFYGASQALFGVSLEVRRGEAVALMGRNGMGKSTTIRSIIGLSRPKKGTITFDAVPIHDMVSYKIARKGIGLVPEGRQIFPTLTVRENLLVAASNYTYSKDPYTVDRVFSIFPRLKERERHLGSALSGGEQQMLAIGRALMINPRLLLLDEATEGLAPLICQEIWKGLEILKNRGLSLLVVDKNLDELLGISDQAFIMEKGKVVWNGTGLGHNLTDDIKRRYIGV